MILLTCPWPALLMLASKDGSGGGSSPPVLNMVLALAAVLVVAAVLMGLLAAVRRGVRQSESMRPRDFSLGDLRDLHREGKLTTDEFERAKAKLVSETRSTLVKEKKPTRAETPFQEELKDA